nr:formin-like protein 5 [Aegilops tauschii subsp. strangulata]
MALLLTAPIPPPPGVPSLAGAPSPYAVATSTPSPRLLTSSSSRVEAAVPAPRPRPRRPAALVAGDPDAALLRPPLRARCPVPTHPGEDPGPPPPHSPLAAPFALRARPPPLPLDSSPRLLARGARSSARAHVRAPASSCTRLTPTPPRSRAAAAAVMCRAPAPPTRPHHHLHRGRPDSGPAVVLCPASASGPAGHRHAGGQFRHLATPRVCPSGANAQVPAARFAC